jgi:hypothetical protein
LSTLGEKKAKCQALPFALVLDLASFRGTLGDHSLLQHRGGTKMLCGKIFRVIMQPATLAARLFQ